MAKTYNTPFVSKLKKLEKQFLLFKKYESIYHNCAVSPVQHLHIAFKVLTPLSGFNSVTVNLEDKFQDEAARKMAVELQNIYRDKALRIIFEIEQAIKDKYSEKSTQDRVIAHWSADQMLVNSTGHRDSRGLKTS